MFKSRRFMLLNTDPNPGGGSVPAPPPAPASPAQPATPEPAGIDPLAFYNTPPAPAPAPAAPAAPVEPQQPAAPAQPEPSTLVGYGNPPAPAAPPAPATPAAPAAPAPTDPPATPPPAAPTEPPADPYVGLVTEGLTAEDATVLKDFAKINNLTPEAAQNFLNLKKEELKLQQTNYNNAKTAHETRVKAQQDQWSSNLRSQWGSNFDSNLHLTEKYIREFMPETNKWLTESKTMVPDYVMRDFYARAKEAYSTGTLPGGATPDSVGGDDYNPLDFYKQK